MYKKTIWIFYLLVALCLVFTPGRQSGHCDAKDDPTLIMGAQRDFMDAGEGKLLVFDTLVTLDAYGNIVPELATSWDITSDGKCWTFSLRRGVVYHDGTAFNAKSAKFALERAKQGAAWATYLDHIKIIDDYRIQVFFNTFYYPFLYNMASAWQAENNVSPSAVEPAWDPKGKMIRFVGTGPFRLIDYQKDRDAVLIKNDDYWGKKPQIEKVLWKYTPDPYAQILALKAGELDIIGAPEHHSSVPFMKLGELQTNKDLIVSIHSYGRYQVLEFNCHRPPFDDVRVRKAFNCAVDRETMVRSLFGQICQPSYLITDPKFLWGPSNIQNGYRYDLKQARELLAEAGWRDINGDGILDKDGASFDVELLVPTGEANADMVVLVVQSQLKEIGVRLTIKNLTNAWDQRLTGKYDLFLGTSGCLPSIPGGIGIADKYHSKGWPFAYHSEQLDALIEAAFTTTNQTQMRQKCDAIWTLLHEANPCIPLYDITKAVVMNQRVNGFKHGATMFDMDLAEITLSR